MGSIKDYIKSYFNLKDDLEDEGVARQAIVEGVSFKGPNIIILVIAILIASLGLSTNSTAVIIGAMLISPLMGPIIGMGLGVGTYDFSLIKRSARNLAMAAGFSVLASTLFFLIAPVSEGHSELLARTSPTIYDVMIGFFGGAAGIVAIACKQKGNVIPGVAIATALMPPLCTAGYGIATWQIQYFYGAFYLFVINSIFISLATLIGVKLFKFKQVEFVDKARKRRIKRIVYTIVILTALPSIYLTILMLRDSLFENEASTFIENEFNLPNTQVFSKDVYIKNWKKYINITLIGEKVNTDSLRKALTDKMNEQGGILKGTRLIIKQGLTINSVNNASMSNQDQNLSNVFGSMFNDIEHQRTQIDSLKGQLIKRQEFDSLSYTIAPEIKVLYPHISNISLMRASICNTETRELETVNIAILEHEYPLTQPLTHIREYLETRTGLKDLHIIETNIGR